MKRLFDIFFALALLLLLGWLVLLCFVIATLETRSNGFFIQKRIGQFGKSFSIIKIKTIDARTDRTTRFGQFFRRYKIDEWPQLINVLKGDMAVVGPRPDVEGYYDQLKGEARNVLLLKPGLTSEASIKYRNEEELLQRVPNPQGYNDQVIFPDKVQMNLNYFYNHSLIGDIKIIFKTAIILFRG